MMIPFEYRMCVAYVMKFYSEKNSHYIFFSSVQFFPKIFFSYENEREMNLVIFFPKWGYSSQNTWSVTSSENSAHHHQTLYCNAITSFDFPFARCVAITFEYFDSLVFFFYYFHNFCAIYFVFVLCATIHYISNRKWISQLQPAS